MTRYLSLATLILGAAVSWSYQSHRYEAKIATLERDAAVSMANAQEKARKEFEAMEKTKNDAINLAYEEWKKQKADADAARADVDRLQRNLASVPKRIEQATRSAVDEFAATNAELFGECTKQYLWMAEEASRNAANARLMLNAWPKK